jgi:hypothetical protein
VTLALDETFPPDQEEYSALVARMQAAGVEVFFLGGYHRGTREAVTRPWQAG